MNGFRGPELQPVHRAAWSERSRSTMWPASSYVQRVCTNLRVVNIAIAPGTAVHCTVWLLQLLLPKVCRGRFEVPEQSSCAPLNDSCKTITARRNVLLALGHDARSHRKQAAA